MRNLLRKPFPWIVICECAIVAALAMVAWHMVASQTAASEDSAPVDALLPGLNLNSEFWRQRLGELNQEENPFEQREWRIVHAGLDAARRYVKSVVMPALARAERGGR